MPSDRSATLMPVAGTGAPSHRTQVLELLLERYTELVDPMQMRNEPGEGSGLLLMPATYTASVRELERLIRQLRDTRHGPIVKWAAKNERDQPETFAASPRALWWHLNGWYIQVERRIVVPPLRPTRNKRKQLVRLPADDDGRPLGHVRVSRVAGARYPIALKAVETLAELWSLPHEPFLPRELQHAA